MVNKLNKEEIDDASIIEEDELASTGSTAYLSSVTIVSVTGTTKTVVCTAGSDFTNSRIANLDKIIITGGAAAGTYTINAVVDDITLTVNETIVDAVGGTVSFYHRDGSLITGFDAADSYYGVSTVSAALKKAVHPYQKPVSAPAEAGNLLRFDHVAGLWIPSTHLVHKTYAPRARFLVTANQTTYLDADDEYVIVVTGSTLGQIIRTPNATLLGLVHHFWVLNESSVPITLQNFDGSNPLNIVAYSNITRVLLDNSTQAGTWNVSLGASWLTGKLRDPRPFSMNGTVGNGNWVTPSELIPDYKYVFTEPVKLIGMEWSNGNGTGRDFDLVFYKNGLLAGNIIRTYQVRNSTYDYGSATLWDNTFVAGDWMRVSYTDQGDNVSDFAGRFNFEVTV